jgi:hypothetical protein
MKLARALKCVVDDARACTADGARTRAVSMHARLCGDVGVAEALYPLSRRLN